MQIKIYTTEIVEIPYGQTEVLLDHLDNFREIPNGVYSKEMTYSSEDIIRQAIRDGLLDYQEEEWIIHPKYDRAEFTREDLLLLEQWMEGS